jgi:hypothetical protein
MSSVPYKNPFLGRRFSWCYGMLSMRFLIHNLFTALFGLGRGMTCFRSDCCYYAVLFLLFLFPKLNRPIQRRFHLFVMGIPMTVTVSEHLCSLLSCQFLHPLGTGRAATPTLAFATFSFEINVNVCSEISQTGPPLVIVCVRNT